MPKRKTATSSVALTTTTTTLARYVSSLLYSTLLHVSKINYIFLEKHTWVGCAMVQLRPYADSSVPSDMVWAVEPGAGAGDEYPEHIKDEDRRFSMCVILYLV